MTEAMQIPKQFSIVGEKSQMLRSVERTVLRIEATLNSHNDAVILHTVRSQRMRLLLRVDTMFVGVSIDCV
jgi:hypothetical protein